MKVRLLAFDSRIPNFAIMKISAYHKAKGDDVAWYNPKLDKDDTDWLYISKIFTFTKDYKKKNLPPYARIFRGGTGYDPMTKLPPEIEAVTDLDYSLYPDCDYSIMFTTRGCIRKCPFCIVPKKEGLIHKIDMPGLNPNGKYIKILDNNFFAYRGWHDNLEALKSYNQPLDFNGGIDLRILTEEQCQALAGCRIRQIHCAWDNYKDKDIILPKINLLTKYIKPRKLTVYVLVGFENKELIPTDIERVMTLKAMGVNPFAMGYIDFMDPEYEKTQIIKDFCRWVNAKPIFKTVSFENYRANVKKNGRAKE
jgi:hypothetical protein